MSSQEENAYSKTDSKTERKPRTTIDASRQNTTATRLTRLLETDRMRSRMHVI